MEEKFSRPNLRIIGNISENFRDKLYNHYLKNYLDLKLALSEKEKEKLESINQPKTENELKAIYVINEMVSQIRSELGLKKIPLNPDNIFLIKSKDLNNFFTYVIKEKYFNLYEKTIELFTAFTVINKNLIILIEEKVRKNFLLYISALFHEVLHLNAYLEFLANDTNGDLMRIFRSGIIVYPLKNSSVLFNSLNEAIVEEIVKLNFSKLLYKLKDSGINSEDIEWFFSKENIAARKLFARNFNLKENEFIIFKENNSENNDKIDLEARTFSYLTQRVLLDYLCRKVKQKFPERYKTKYDVLKDFVLVHFNGDLAFLKDIIEKTFGVGAFKIISQLEDDFQDDEKSRKVIYSLINTLEQRIRSEQ